MGLCAALLFAVCLYAFTVVGHNSDSTVDKREARGYASWIVLPISHWVGVRAAYRRGTGTLANNLRGATLSVVQWGVSFCELVLGNWLLLAILVLSLLPTAESVTWEEVCRNVEFHRDAGTVAAGCVAAWWSKWICAPERKKVSKFGQSFRRARNCRFKNMHDQPLRDVQRGFLQGKEAKAVTGLPAHLRGQVQTLDDIAEADRIWRDGCAVAATANGPAFANSYDWRAEDPTHDPNYGLMVNNVFVTNGVAGSLILASEGVWDAPSAATLELYKSRGVDSATMNLLDKFHEAAKVHGPAAHNEVLAILLELGALGVQRAELLGVELVKRFEPRWLPQWNPVERTVEAMKQHYKGLGDTDHALIDCLAFLRESLVGAAMFEYAIGAVGTLKGTNVEGALVQRLFDVFSPYTCIGGITDCCAIVAHFVVLDRRDF